MVVIVTVYNSSSRAQSFRHHVFFFGLSETDSVDVKHLRILRLALMVGIKNYCKVCQVRLNISMVGLRNGATCNEDKQI